MNTSDRNDFYRVKVARENKNFYFYVKAVVETTENSGSN
jgi:hypothetical protein